MLAVTVEEKLTAAVEQAGELGDDLLRILVRAVDIVASDNDDGELEGLCVGVDQHLRSGLGRSVGVCGAENAVLDQIGIIVSHFSVYLVGGDVDEAGDAAVLGGLKKNVSAVDVGVGKLKGVTEAEIDVRLSSKVEDGVDVVGSQAVANVLGVADVTVVEGEVLHAVESPDVGHGCTVVELVEADNIVHWVGDCKVSDDP